MRRLLCAAGAIGWVYLWFFLGHLATVANLHFADEWWGFPTFLLVFLFASLVEGVLLSIVLFGWEEKP
jgi:hypothetical protein